jgi:predicted porin
MVYMKIRHLAIASALLVAGAAHAQSSVTLYGLIDTSLLYINSAKGPNGQGASNWMLNSGSVYTSRWGLRGTEDLGGGLSAVFDLENGFNSTNGTFKNGGDIFGRQAWVGLSSKQYGQLTLGRQYDFLVDFVAPMSATGSGWGGNLASHPYDNDNLDNDLRLNNSIKFSSVSYNGLKFGAMYAFSGQPGGFGNDNAYSLGASYVNGPIRVGAAYLQINRSTTLANATGAVTTGDGDPLTLGGSQQIYGAGAQYMFGRSSVGVVWTHSVTYNVTGIFANGSTTNNLSGPYIKFDNFEINGRYFVRPDFSLAAAYTYTTGGFGGSSGMPAASPHWNQVTAQADYILSPRTDVYLMGVYQRVSGGNGITVFNAEDYNVPQSSTNAQIVVGVGMKHRF